jgi:iron complex outermembrane receptor protein
MAADAAMGLASVSGATFMFRNLFLGSTALAAVFGATSVFAQTAPPPASSTEIIVTGSRIARTNLEQPTPVSVLSPQVIQNAGTPNLGDS